VSGRNAGGAETADEQPLGRTRWSTDRPILGICVKLKLRAESGVPTVNSRDVAEAFERQHQHVLRHIVSARRGPPSSALHTLSEDREHDCSDRTSVRFGPSVHFGLGGHQCR